MLKFRMALLRRFLRDHRGNVAIIFGIVIVPIILIVGVAVDYGRAMTVRGTMSDAADAAGLAIGSWVGLSQAELEDRAQKFFDANYASALARDIKSDFEVDFDDDNIIVKATASVPTTFLRVADVPNLNVAVENTIRKRQRNIELALVLDTTGSMRWSGKMDALQSAANRMVSDLFGQETVSETLDVAVVPFAAAVNVGKDNKSEDWLDKEAKSKVAREDFGNGKKPFELFGKLKSVRSSWDWQGCVREREGSAYELTDATPTTSEADSLFAPYFAPDEPDQRQYDGRSYPNSYISDGDCGERKSENRTTDNCQRYWGKYDSPKRTYGGSGPNQHCPPAAVTPLSDTKSKVTDAIDALEPNGYTNIPAGLLWGWRVLSPGAPFTEAEDYDEEERVKAIVLLTDGSNDPGSRYNHNGSNYNAFGYPAEGHLGNTSGSGALTELNAKTATICNNIKAKGILIYTIGFRVSSSATHKLLRACATEPDMYYNSPSNSQLAAIFGDIAQGLSELRIAQ